MEDSELWSQPVTYAAVGATQAGDLLAFPPTGFRPMVRRVRIGHGEQRFDFAWSEALSWGIQRRSGFEVHVAEAPPEIREQTYVPLSFDEEGNPVAARPIDHSMFGPDGTPFLVPGDSATLVIPVFGISAVKAPARVVYVIDEPTRKGFAYGTLPGHPESGEEAFVVELMPDGSVWLTITAISRPSAWFWWMCYPILKMFQAFYTRRYLSSLSGPLPTSVKVEPAE